MGQLEGQLREVKQKFFRTVPRQHQDVDAELRKITKIMQAHNID